MTSRPSLLRSLAANESGATAVVIGLSMTVMMGFVGMAVDAGLWYADQRTVQGAADSGAYTAAIDSAAGDSASGVTAAAQAILPQYGLSNASNVTMTVNTPPLSGSHTTTSGAVEVIVTKKENLFFSSFFTNAVTVSGRAVAVVGGSGGKYCVESLDNTAGGGTTTSLSNGVQLNISNCGIAVNGPSSSALSIVGGANLQTNSINVVGGITINNGGQINLEGTGATKTTNGTAVADPYSSVTLPTAGASCDHTNASYNNGGAGNTTIGPGTYCGGLTAGNGNSITMSPGVYIINGGQFSMQGGITVTATSGVTIVLTGNATASVANGVTLNLTAPSTGATAGLAMVSDQNETGTNSFQGGAKLNVTGALYFRKQSVNIANGSVTSNSNCMQLIAWDLTFAGGMQLNDSSCSATGVKGIGATSTALVE